MGALVEFARRVLEARQGGCGERTRESAGPPLAVKIGGSVIGDFWIVLCDEEPFDPGDGIPIYRPSEMKAMLGKGYGPDALQAVHLIKTAFDGKMVS